MAVGDGDNNNGLAVFGAIAGLALIGFLAWAVMVSPSPPVLQAPTTWAEFGDAFGPLTGFASALALAAAVWSIRLQQAELAETRQELMAQRVALEQSNKLTMATHRLSAAALEVQSEIAMVELLRTEEFHDGDPTGDTPYGPRDRVTPEKLYKKLMHQSHRVAAAWGDVLQVHDDITGNEVAVVNLDGSETTDP